MLYRLLRLSFWASKSCEFVQYIHQETIQNETMVSAEVVFNPSSSFVNISTTDFLTKDTKQKPCDVLFSIIQKLLIMGIIEMLFLAHRPFICFISRLVYRNSCHWFWKKKLNLFAVIASLCRKIFICEEEIFSWNERCFVFISLLPAAQKKKLSPGGQSLGRLLYVMWNIIKVAKLFIRWIHLLTLPSNNFERVVSISVTLLDVS